MIKLTKTEHSRGCFGCHYKPMAPVTPHAKCPKTDGKLTCCLQDAAHIFVEIADEGDDDMEYNNGVDDGRLGERSRVVQLLTEHGFHEAADLVKVGT